VRCRQPWPPSPLTAPSCSYGYRYATHHLNGYHRGATGPLAGSGGRLRWAGGTQRGRLGGRGGQQQLAGAVRRDPSDLPGESHGGADRPGAATGGPPGDAFVGWSRGERVDAGKSRRCRVYATDGPARCTLDQIARGRVPVVDRHCRVVQARWRTAAVELSQRGTQVWRGAPVAGAAAVRRRPAMRANNKGSERKRGRRCSRRVAPNSAKNDQIYGVMQHRYRSGEHCDSASAREKRRNTKSAALVRLTGFEPVASCSGGKVPHTNPLSQQ